MLLCIQFEGTIGAKGLTFKLLERRLNNNFEPPNELLTMQEVSNQEVSKGGEQRR